ncbi:MAG TPA: hypothetical protein PL151_17945 [Phycisphaerae bacterium]|nr:hypothetical protein [Phycisphaerae bacterium]HOJ75534.1 hypothetical protein [Phycisphaerae bacterium]HOM52829.1 hypothetical protein [Phycisphaerae bacterium]HON66957.1 hypothetical protein [Phycisphaerae bacterium]HOQ87905.1 hypothetical protein [Phycisphaerae bacterium]
MQSRLWGVLSILTVTSWLFQTAWAASPDGKQAAVPAFGLWYTVWWTADDEYRHWCNCNVFPTRGRYTAGDPAVIADHYAQMRDMGVDFIIMDDTNCAGVDGGRINDNIRAWFDFMDARPAAERIPICIGSGGEMRGGGKAAQARAADFYWEAWAQRPSYFKLEGKPLLLVDTDDNYGPGDFDDPRFTVRWAYNGDNFESMGKRQTWGWGSYEPAPIVSECMSIWPGHRFPGPVRKQGLDPLEEPREGGQLYVRMWLRVLKARPRYVTVADFNNFEEETAIEASYTWEDPRGHAVPDLYIRITRACSRLRTETPVKGEYYRDENEPEVYLFDGRQFVHQNAMPRRATVILTPAGMLERMRQKFGTAPRSAP